MPTYSYACLTCKVRIEVVHGIKEHETFQAPLCPKCQLEMERFIEAGTTFILLWTG